jgi:hypothetical protein
MWACHLLSSEAESLDCCHFLHVLSCQKGNLIYRWPWARRLDGSGAYVNSSDEMNHC